MAGFWAGSATDGSRIPWKETKYSDQREMDRVQIRVSQVALEAAA